MKTFKTDLNNIKIPSIIIILYSIFMQINFKTVCPFRAIFHFRCPACGLTHATIYLFLFRLHDAWSANPTVYLWIPTIILFCYDRYIKKLNIEIFPYCFICVGLITFMWYFLSLV